MNYLQRIQKETESVLPKDVLFRSCLRNSYNFFPHDGTFSEKDICESKRCVEDILCFKDGVETYDAKHLHVITFLCLAWTDKEELITSLLLKTPYNKIVIKQFVASLFVCRNKWTSLAKIEEFYGWPIEQVELISLAYSAGGSGNLSLVRDLRNLDSNLLNSAYQGAKDYEKESTMTKLKAMGMPFPVYVASLNVAREDSALNIAKVIIHAVIAMMLFALVLRS